MGFLIGVDIGTSLIKAAVYDAAGKQYGLASEKVAVVSPKSGYAEQDPLLVWQGTAQCIQRCLAEAKIRGDDVQAVACAAQGDGVWAIDKNGNPAGNAILWCDNRASAIISEWEQSGLLREHYKKSGTVLWAGASAPILAWLKTHDPGYYQNIETYFCCKDWVNYKLTGKKATDITDGTISFMHLAEQTIDVAQASLFGLEETISRLPKLSRSFDIIGTITPEASRETGLPAGVPVCAGLLDVTANALGAGVTQPGQVFLIIGTTLLNAVVMDAPHTEPDYIGATVSNAIPGQWLRVLAAQSGTPNFDWLVRELSGSSPVDDLATVYAAIEREVTQSSTGANGLIYLPYIKGERSPFLNPYASACFLGITEDTTKSDMLRAVFEGVAYSSRHNFDALGRNVQEVIATGGGTVNACWCQIFSDVTGCALHIPARKELGTAGAAIIAARGIGAIEDFSFPESESEVIQQTYTPEKATQQALEAGYELFKLGLAQMQSFWSARKDLLKR